MFWNTMWHILCNAAQSVVFRISLLELLVNYFIVVLKLRGDFYAFDIEKQAITRMTESISSLNKSWLKCILLPFWLSTALFFTVVCMNSLGLIDSLECKYCRPIVCVPVSSSLRLEIGDGSATTNLVLSCVKCTFQCAYVTNST